jgi:thioester reductase-like protein
MITGDSKTGASQTNDLVCRLIKGLAQLGSAPDLDLQMSLTPVDYVSQAIVHLSLQSASVGKAFHLVSPDAVPLPRIVEELQVIGYPMECIDYQQWQARLLKVASSQAENALSPLLFLFTQWKAGSQQSYLETAALVSQGFDAQNTLAGLVGTSITCPRLDSRLLRAYFSYLGLKDVRNDYSEESAQPSTRERESLVYDDYFANCYR